MRLASPGREAGQRIYTRSTRLIKHAGLCCCGDLFVSDLDQKLAPLLCSYFQTRISADSHNMESQCITTNKPSKTCTSISTTFPSTLFDLFMSTKPICVFFQQEVTKRPLNFEDLKSSSKSTTVPPCEIICGSHHSTLGSIIVVNLVQAMILAKMLCPQRVSAAWLNAHRINEHALFT
jgi:hypothetical protein